MATYNTSDFRKGLKVEIDGEPYLMTEMQFVKPGKGNAFYKCKMKNLVHLECDPKREQCCIESLFRDLKNGSWVHLFPNKSNNRLIQRRALPKGPGVVVASGGSSGGRKYCFQPCEHLDQSANATASWLQSLGLQPKNCLIFNPLPLHHVSGLMPLWRSKCWGAEYVSVPREIMRNPILAENSFGERFEIYSSVTLSPYTDLKILVIFSLSADIFS